MSFKKRKKSKICFQQRIKLRRGLLCFCVCATMTAGGRLTFLALLCRNASWSLVSLAVAGSMRPVVTMALPGHPNPHKQSPVAWREKRWWDLMQCSASDMQVSLMSYTLSNHLKVAVFHFNLPLFDQIILSIRKTIKHHYPMIAGCEFGQCSIMGDSKAVIN